jgi:hypothetical protein
MLKLLVIKCFRSLFYARIILFLTPEDPLPHPTTLHHFVKYRLGVDGLNRLWP